MLACEFPDHAPRPTFASDVVFDIAAPRLVFMHDLFDDGWDPIEAEPFLQEKLYRFLVRRVEHGGHALPDAKCFVRKTETREFFDIGWQECHLVDRRYIEALQGRGKAVRSSERILYW